MRIAVLGGTGRTGRFVVADLYDRGHDLRMLVRTPTAPPDGIENVDGDARDPVVLARLVERCEVVVSTLGPVAKDRRLHRDVAPLLIAAMTQAGCIRFVGISAAGIDIPGDAKSPRDRVISTLIQRWGGDAARDKTLEYQSWRDSRLDWTLVRPPRLIDGPATGSVDHGAHTSLQSTKVTRADLAAFIVDLVESPDYVRQAPFVAAHHERRGGMRRK
jgi:putative NADH-flavin reductase